MKICKICKIGGRVDFKKLKKFLPEIEDRLESDILIISKKNRKAVIFNYGVVVFWNYAKDEEEQILKLVKKCLIAIDVKERTLDDFHYVESNVFKIENDKIRIDSFASDVILSISYALSQSVLLDDLEELINKMMIPTNQLLSDLEEKGKIGISSKEIKKTIGYILHKNFEINLELNLLDKPEYFWENPMMETYYLKTRNYLDIEERIDVLTEKLSTLKSILEILRDEKNAIHAARLEWIIVGLILIEIIMAFFI